MEHLGNVKTTKTPHGKYPVRLTGTGTTWNWSVHGSRHRIEIGGHKVWRPLEVKPIHRWLSQWRPSSLPGFGVNRTIRDPPPCNGVYCNGFGGSVPSIWWVSGLLDAWKMKPSANTRDSTHRYHPVQQFLKALQTARLMRKVMATVSFVGTSTVHCFNVAHGSIY